MRGEDMTDTEAGKQVSNTPEKENEELEWKHCCHMIERHVRKGWDIQIQNESKGPKPKKKIKIDLKKGNY